MGLENVMAGDVVAVVEYRPNRKPQMYSMVVKRAGAKFLATWSREIRFHRDTGWEATKRTPTLRAFATEEEARNSAGPAP